MSDPKHEPGKQVLADGKHVRFVSRDGWEYVERKNVSGIVGIVAVTDDGKLLLVEQHRPPVRGRVIELAAGLAGDVRGHEAEQLAEAARRELLEETGYEARDMTLLAEGAASAGITSEIITLFLAQGLRKTGEGKGDGSEDLTLHEVPVEALRSWLDARRAEGTLIDLKIYSGMYFLAQKP